MSWTVLFGLICRCCLGVTRRDCRTAQHLQVYVEDPAMVVAGTAAARRRTVAYMIVSWLVLGISLAVKKGQLGTKIDWVGITIDIRTWGVRATILEARLTEVRQIADDIASNNVVPLRTLRTFVGKVQ